MGKSGKGEEGDQSGRVGVQGAAQLGDPSTNTSTPLPEREKTRGSKDGKERKESEWSQTAKAQGGRSRKAREGGQRGGGPRGGSVGRGGPAGGSQVSRGGEASQMGPWDLSQGLSQSLDSVFPPGGNKVVEREEKSGAEENFSPVKVPGADGWGIIPPTQE